MKRVDTLLKKAQIFEEKAESALDQDIFKVIIETLNQNSDLASELWEFYVNMDMVHVTFPEELFTKVMEKTGVDREKVDDVYDNHKEEIQDLLSSMFGDIWGERYSLSVSRGY